MHAVLNVTVLSTLQIALVLYMTREVDLVPCSELVVELIQLRDAQVEGGVCLISQGIEYS